MNKLYTSLSALPIRLRPDVLLALGVSFIVAMLVIPMPLLLLDALIAVNIAGGLVILLVSLFARRALDLSSFPTLLLVTTLFRLGLNVSTTRGILSRGDGGEVVAAFGHFVLQGDVVVGIAIFLVLALVQFLVIAKGAERVAEVGARFTLDAMPGKQMSIDAALRAGAITEEDADKKRRDLGRESQLFGNMDGAMKFVKGDAIAGLVITALNFVAGLIIGVLRRGMSAGEALDTYSILAVGDALVSQIPALLITLAAGILVTRVEGAEKGSNLGSTVTSELFANKKVLAIAGALMGGLGAVPGLPAIPFFALAALAFTAAATGVLDKLAAAVPEPGTKPATELDKKLETQVAQAKAQRSIADQIAPSVVPLGIDLDPVLTRALGFDEHAPSPELVATYIPQLRDALYLETGVRFPGVRVRTDVVGLPAATFVIRINDVPALQDKFSPELYLAVASPTELRKLGVIAAPIVHPVSGAELALVTEGQRAVVQAAGIRTWDAAGYIALSFGAVLRKRAKHFLGFQEVSEMIERLEKAYPALVREVVPKVINIGQLVDVLRRLVDEGVCIRDLKSIVQSLGEHGGFDGDVLYLTEKARGALAYQIAYSCAGLGGRLSVVLLDPVIEDSIAAGIVDVKGGKTLSMDPAVCREIINSMRCSLRPVLESGARPAILTNAEIRRFVHRMCEGDLPGVAVLSFDELPDDLVVQPMGRASLAA